MSSPSSVLLQATAKSWIKCGVLSASQNCLTLFWDTSDSLLLSRSRNVNGDNQNEEIDPFDTFAAVKREHFRPRLKPSATCVSFDSSKSDMQKISGRPGIFRKITVNSALISRGRLHETRSSSIVKD